MYLIISNITLYHVTEESKKSTLSESAHKHKAIFTLATLSIISQHTHPNSSKVTVSPGLTGKEKKPSILDAHEDSGLIKRATSSESQAELLLASSLP